MNALRDSQEDRQNSNEKDTHSHEENVVVEVVWQTATKKSVKKRETCDMNDAGSTAKEEEIFTFSFWWFDDVMKKKKRNKVMNRSMDNDVTSGKYDVTKEENEKSGLREEENDAGNKENNQWLSPILWIAIETKTFELELEFKQKKTY